MSTTTAYKVQTRQKILIAAAISLLLHLFTIAGVTTYFSSSPVKPAPVEEKPVELVLIAPPPNLRPPPIDVTGAQITEKSPEKAAFISDRNAVAASEKAPTGSLPIPTQDGIDRTGVQLENRNYRPGQLNQPPAPVPQNQTNQPPEPQSPEPDTAPKPQTDLALLEPPKPKTQPKPTPNARPPGFQDSSRVTRLSGNLSNRGRSSVNAMATPLGRYHKSIRDAIASRWQYYTEPQIDLLDIGKVRISFNVQPDGKVKNIRVVSNTSNESLAAVTVRSIMDAEIPPMPENVTKALKGNVLEINWEFMIY